MRRSLGPHMVFVLLSSCTHTHTQQQRDRTRDLVKTLVYLIYVIVCSHVSVCVCTVHASLSTQRPSQRPLVGRERMQRSNEGVISLAGRLPHY